MAASDRTKGSKAKNEKSKGGGSPGAQAQGEWVLGKFSLGVPVSVEGARGVPYGLVWLEMPSGAPLGVGMELPQKELNVRRAFAGICAEPMFGPPRRPKRVRTADADLARALSGEPGLTVQVGPTPECDEFATAIQNEFTSRSEGLLERFKGRLTEAMEQRLFAAARALYLAEPWKRMPEAQVLEVSVPELDKHGLCVSVLGAQGLERALLIFDSIDDFDDFLAHAESGPDADEAMGVHWIALSFEPGEALPEEAVQRVAERGLPLASKEAYPLLEYYDDAGMPQSAEEAHGRLASCIAAALAEFTTRHAGVLASQREEPFSARIDLEGLPAVQLTYHPMDESDEGEDHEGHAHGEHDDDDVEGDFEDEDEDEDDEELEPFDSEAMARARLANVGRNDPCPCGSAHKYKKCHRPTDEEQARSAALTVPKEPSGE